MSKYEPKTGTTGTCVHCGKPIEYVSGPPYCQWVHLRSENGTVSGPQCQIYASPA